MLTGHRCNMNRLRLCFYLRYILDNDILRLKPALSDSVKLRTNAHHFRQIFIIDVAHAHNSINAVCNHGIGLNLFKGEFLLRIRTL